MIRSRGFLMVRCATCAIVGWILAASFIVGCGDQAAEQSRTTAGSADARADTGTGTGPLARPGGSADTQSVTLQMAEPIRKYGTRSGVVEYVNARLGRKQTLYFDKGGADEAVYLESGNDSVGVPFDVSIYTGVWRFDYNRDARTGIAKMQPNAPGAMLGILPDLRNVSITPLEPRTIAGQRTSGISFGRPPTRAWMWKGIPLRIELPLRGGADTLVLEAISVNVAGKIPAERFQVPDEIVMSRLK